MNSISTPTSALQQSVRMAEQALRHRHESSGSTEADTGSTGYVFTGNIQHTAPHNLVMDPILGPTDKMTWIVMRAGIQNPQMPGSIPSRQQLADAVNCSPPTITNSRNMLRICRWMTFSHQVRDNNNRFIGDVYLLHEEPLGLSETLEIDAGFLAFLGSIQSNNSTNKATRSQAALVHQEILSLNHDPVPFTQLQSMDTRMSAASRLPSWDSADSASTLGATQWGDNSTTATQNQSQSKILNTAQDANRSSFDQRRHKTPENQSAQSQSKILSMDTQPQSKNFTLGNAPDAKSQSKILSMDEPRGLQSDFGNIDGNLNTPEQVKKIFPSICSSTCSSSSYNNLSKRAGESPDGFASQSTSAEPDVKTKLISEAGLDPSEVDTVVLEMELELLLDIERSLRQHLPWLLAEGLKPHYGVFSGYLPSLPIVGSLINTLPPEFAQDVSSQIFARLLLANHPTKHYRSEPVRNLVGFTKELIKRVRGHEFSLDDYGLMVKETALTGFSLTAFEGKELVKGVPLPKKLPLEI